MYQFMLFILLAVSASGSVSADTFSSPSAPTLWPSPHLLWSSDALVLSGPSQVALAPTGLESPSGLEGAQNVLVLTVQFTDLSHSTTGKVDEAVSELAKYWGDVSYGKISLRTTVSAKWYTLQQTHAYYGANPETSSRKIEFITDAVSVSASDFNYNDYSYLIIVHAGDSEGHSRNAGDIWDAGTIGRGTVATSTGSFLLGVAIVAEKDPVGPYAHELGHNFGLVDLWDYKVADAACPWCDTFVGEWDLMAHGCWSGNGTTPAGLSSWSLLRLGWLEASAVATIKAGEKAQHEVRPLESTSPAVIKVTITDSTYYLVEARQKIGWDRNLPDDGVLIFYVDDGKGNGEGPVRYKAPEGKLDKAWRTNQFYVDEANQLIIAPASADASFNFQIVTYGASATGKFDITVNAPYPDLPVVLDGKEHRTGQNGVVVVKEVAFGAHNLTIQSIHIIDQGVRGIFSGWSDGETSNSRTLVVISDTNVTATYRMQYLLTVLSDVPVNGSGWHDAESQATLEAEPFVDYGNHTRSAFVGWTGDLTGTSPSVVVVMDDPKTVTAHWSLQYELTVTSAYGTPEGGGWYNASVTATVSVEGTVEVEAGVRAVFSRWTGDVSSVEPRVSVEMDKPKSVTANWQMQHLVSVRCVDMNDASVSAPSPVLVFSHAGQETRLNQSGEVWLDVGDYTLLAAEWHGINVSATNVGYATSPNGVWQVNLSLYNVTVHVRSVITSLPVKDARITVPLPDGAVLTAITNNQGAAVFSQMPGGMSYNATVTAQYLPQGFTLTVGSTNADVAVRMPVTLEVGIIAAAASVSLTAVLVVVKRRRERRMRERALRKRKLHLIRTRRASSLRKYLESL
jgi:M6 family metalloprotease-like protein/uncharacterized repeat protein (TIGR02543 family)